MNVVEWHTSLAEAFLAQRQLAYQNKFGSKIDLDADIVLRDLAKYCRAGQTVFDVDPRVHALLTGRQEVWLRIQQHLNLPLDRLYDIYGGPKYER